MPESNQFSGGSKQSLEDVLKTIRLKLTGLKGGPVLILIAVVVVVTIFWGAWFTVQPEDAL